MCYKNHIINIVKLGSSSMLRVLSSLFSTFCFFAVIGIVVVIMVVLKFSSELPDIDKLSIYEPPVTTRLYAGDGQLLMEYASEKRIFIPERKIPDLVKKAFIATEDQRFYRHFGIDYVGIIRAMLTNVKNVGLGRRPVGASTITQQVAKNFLLTSELSYARKIKEMMLAVKIEQTFTKEHIMELYLNEIYLGNRSYGVAAASLNYFGKSLNDLTIEEMAYLAALPKGPNNYNPKTKYNEAIARRNWIIDRMTEESYILPEEGELAKLKPLVTIERSEEYVKYADYFSEEVRRVIKTNFGEEALYEGGLLVRTTLNPTLQEIATKTFREGLDDYDKRHGYRGPFATVDMQDENYKKLFEDIKKPEASLETWEKALVTKLEDKTAHIQTSAGKKGKILLSSLSWAGKTLKNQSISGSPTKISDVFAIGDVVMVEKAKDESSYDLRQVPNIEGGMIVMDPHTGKVLAVVGGYSFDKSQFNRATQAKRQTGSVFKPVVYLTALENGYAPNDLILDAPFVLNQGPGLPTWKPTNYGKKFYGLLTLRQGLEKSRNLMTVRLAKDIGMDKVSEMTRLLGINNNLPLFLANALGASDTRLIDISKGYASFVNGGKKISPYFIERVQDRKGTTVFKQDNRDCTNCNFDEFSKPAIPNLIDNREQIIDPLSAYQMTYMLEGVIQRGTGARAKSVNKHIAGKTGTTNENKDVWFIGFSPDLVVGIYVGFDEPRSLGKSDTAANVTVPIFKGFMEKALKNQSDIPFRTPAGIKFVRVNYDTGKPATPFDKSVILEAIKPETKTQKVINGDEDLMAQDSGNENNVMTYSQDDEDEFGLGTEY